MAVIADDGLWRDVGDLRTPFLLLGLGRPLLRRENGLRDSARAAEALAFTSVLTEGLKRTVRERQPNGDGLDSFPSGHASTTFTVATMNAAYSPREAPLWYAGATLISISRNETGAHFFHDVVAGAALGYGVARALIGRPNGVLIAPIFSHEARGATLSFRF